MRAYDLEERFVGDIVTLVGRLDNVRSAEH